MTLNPYSLTIHDLISYLDSLAIWEETQSLIQKGKAGFSEYQIQVQQKKTGCAQLLLRLAKQAAAQKEPNTLLALLNEIPE
ncbi:MAG: hypothetical protein Q8L07_04135 [Sediminibacterium sp.]|nr:hypothetical protein [Sediminibacterium sp.]